MNKEGKEWRRKEDKKKGKKEGKKKGRKDCNSVTKDNT
jgi:hypothetical protein